MVTVLCRQRHGYDVRIYTDDHLPAHVHVFKGEKRVQVYLDPIEFEDNHGFNTRELGRIRDLIEENIDLLMRMWVNIIDDLTEAGT